MKLIIQAYSSYITTVSKTKLVMLDQIYGTYLVSLSLNTKSKFLSTPEHRSIRLLVADYFSVYKSCLLLFRSNLSSYLPSTSILSCFLILVVWVLPYLRSMKHERSQVMLPYIRRACRHTRDIVLGRLLQIMNPFDTGDTYIFS